MKFISAILLFLTAAALIYGRSVVHFFNQTEDDQIWSTNQFMISDALAWVLVFMTMALPKYEAMKPVSWILAFLAIGKLLDEIFFEPYKLQWNDLLTFNITAILVTVLITQAITKPKP